MQMEMIDHMRKVELQRIEAEKEYKREELKNRLKLL